MLSADISSGSASHFDGNFDGKRIFFNKKTTFSVKEVRKNDDINDNSIVILYLFFLFWQVLSLFYIP